eukprot:sb/3468850/
MSGAGRQVATKIVRPILSKNAVEARAVVLYLSLSRPAFVGVTALYRDFYRELDWTCRSHLLDVSIADARKKLRSEFLKHKDVTDVRVIDMMVVKGRLTLEEFHDGGLSRKRTILSSTNSTSHLTRRRNICFVLYLSLSRLAFVGVTALYRDFYRELDWTCRSHLLDVSIADARKKLRSEFLKHKDVTDVRVIDMMVVKGRLTLEEFHEFWAQSYNAYAYFDDTQTQRRIVKEKDDSFLDKFYKSSN